MEISRMSIPSVSVAEKYNVCPVSQTKKHSHLFSEEIDEKWLTQ